MAREDLIAVVGAGIAALAACEELRAAGFRVLVVSGSKPAVVPPRVLVCPRLRRGTSREALFIRQAYRIACQFYEKQAYCALPSHNSRREVIVGRGALRLAQNIKEQQRMRLLAKELPHLCAWLEPSEAKRISGLTELATAFGGNLFPSALTLVPRSLFANKQLHARSRAYKIASTKSTCRQKTKTIYADIVGLSCDGNGRYRLFSRQGEIATGEAVRSVVLAVGSGLPSLLLSLFPQQASFLQPLLDSLQISSGRIDHCARDSLLQPPLLSVCAAGWVVPWYDNWLNTRISLSCSLFNRKRVGVVRGLAHSRENAAVYENCKRLIEWCAPHNNKSSFKNCYQNYFLHPIGYPREHSIENSLALGRAYTANRLATRDRFPLLGKLPISDQLYARTFDRLFIFFALAGHGFLTAPLCAQLLAHNLSNSPNSCFSGHYSPTEYKNLCALLDPNRFFKNSSGSNR